MLATLSTRIAIGRGDHPHIDAVLNLIGSDPLNLAGLEKPQQQALHPRAGLADFVHEDGAAMGLLERAEPVPVGTGETAADMAEELGFEQRFGQRGAVDGDERRTAAGARGVNEPGDDLFAGTALAGDENLGVTAGGVVDFVVKRENCGTRPNELGRLHNSATWGISGSRGYASFFVFCQATAMPKCAEVTHSWSERLHTHEQTFSPSRSRLLRLVKATFGSHIRLRLSMKA